MIVRELLSQDIEHIINPAQQMYLDHDLKEQELFTPNSFEPERIKEYFLNTLNNKFQKTFVAEENGEVLGFIRCEIKETPRFYKERKVGFTDDLVVIKKYQRTGVGTKLKKKAEEWFKKKDIKLLECKIYEWNIPSAKLSEKLGYKKTFSYYYKHI